MTAVVRVTLLQAARQARNAKEPGENDRPPKSAADSAKQWRKEQLGKKLKAKGQQQQQQQQQQQAQKQQQQQQEAAQKRWVVSRLPAGCCICRDSACVLRSFDWLYCSNQEPTLNQHSHIGLGQPSIVLVPEGTVFIIR